jgi:hypothetical protein
MAGESVTFTQTTPSDWQSLLGSVTKGLADVAIARLNGQSDRVREVQQAPVANSEFRKWVPWIIGGTLLTVVLVAIVKRR